LKKGFFVYFILIFGLSTFLFGTQADENCKDCYEKSLNEGFDDGFDSLFEELGEIMTEVEDRSVLDSTDSEINPKVAELCRYIENGKDDLLADVLNNAKHTFLEKREEGKHYSFNDLFNRFKCKEKFSGSLKPSMKTEKLKPLEISVLHSRRGGIVVFKQLLEKIRSLSPEDRLKIIDEKNENGQDLIDFIDGVRLSYIQRIKESGMNLKSNDSIIVQINSMKAEVENLRREAL